MDARLAPSAPASGAELARAADAVRGPRQRPFDPLRFRPGVYAGRLLPLGRGRAEDGVLGGLGDAELDDLLGRDLDLLAGGRVPARPGLAVDQHQLADA